MSLSFISATGGLVEPKFRASDAKARASDPTNMCFVKLEKWVHPEFVHGIASGAPVPLKGAEDPGRG